MENGSYRVLVVDDEASVLFTYRLLLERQGYETTAVASCSDAIAALRERPYHLLLCDLSLEEDHTGFEVFDFARARNPSVPCVLLTGYADAGAAQKAEAEGITVLYKPIDIQEFLTTIPALLRDTYEQAQTGNA